MMNSKGLFAYNKDYRCYLSLSPSVTKKAQVRVMQHRGYNDVTKLDTLAATKIAAQKANGSAAAKAIEPGKYTVILEPVAASCICLEICSSDLMHDSADEGRSFMSKKGGGTSAWVNNCWMKR